MLLADFRVFTEGTWRLIKRREILQKDLVDRRENERPPVSLKFSRNERLNDNRNVEAQFQPVAYWKTRRRIGLRFCQVQERKYDTLKTIAFCKATR